MSTKERILEQLERHRGESVSGEHLAEVLNISRNAVWKAVKELQKNGYHIVAVTNKGYCLSEENDIIDERMGELLKAHFMKFSQYISAQKRDVIREIIGIEGDLDMFIPHQDFLFGHFNTVMKLMSNQWIDKTEEIIRMRKELNDLKKQVEKKFDVLYDKRSENTELKRKIFTLKQAKGITGSSAIEMHFTSGSKQQSNDQMTFDGFLTEQPVNHSSGRRSSKGQLRPVSPTSVSTQPQRKKRNSIIGAFKSVKGKQDQK